MAKAKPMKFDLPPEKVVQSEDVGYKIREPRKAKPVQKLKTVIKGNMDKISKGLKAY